MKNVFVTGTDTGVGKTVVTAALVAMARSKGIDAVPFKVMNDCGLDFNRWYPLHRRIMAGLKLAHNKRENATTLKAALDKFQTKHDIKCGLLQRD